MQSDRLISAELKGNRRSDGRIHRGGIGLHANVSNEPFVGDRVSDSRTTVHPLSELVLGFTSLFSTGIIDAKSLIALIISFAD
jgi:hypothetical protein